MLISADDFGEDLEKMINYVFWVTLRVKEVNVTSHLNSIKNHTAPVSPITEIVINMNSRDMSTHYEDEQTAEIVEKVFCMLLTQIC